jgi:hypothetical protein
MLDRRDIQTLMYCIRITEAAGLWVEASEERSPHELELKLARFMRAIEERRVTPAA